MRSIMSGEVSPTLIAAIIIGLRVKKETIGEIAAAAEVMREFATKVAVEGRRQPGRHRAAPAATARTPSTSRPRRRSSAPRPARASPSTATARYPASRAAPTCWKRSASTSISKPEQIARCIDEVGVGFMFAPNHHGAMKHAAPVRRELGVKTIFNILGPLTNPAGAKQQLIGVFHPDLVGIQVRVLQRLGSRRVIVVHGLEGLDEISHLRSDHGGRAEGRRDPRIQRSPRRISGCRSTTSTAIRVDGVEQSKAMVLAALANEPGAARDIVALNAGASIYVAGLAPTVADGVKKAQAVIASGAARKKLDEFVAFTRSVNA